MARPNILLRWVRTFLRQKPQNRRSRRVGLRVEPLERRDVPSSTAINAASRLFSAGTFNAGMESFTGSLTRSLDEALAGLGNLPLVGARLRDAAEPVITGFKSANTLLQSSVNALYASAQQDIVAGLQISLFNSFGPSGAKLLLEADGTVGLSKDDILRSGAKVLSDTAPYSQLAMRLGGSYHIDVPLDLALSSAILTGMPGLDFKLAANNGVRIQFDWNAHLGVGFDLNTPLGFYFVSNSMNEYGQPSPEFTGTVSAFAAPPKDAAGKDLPATGPGLAASVNVGSLSATATDGITEGLSASAAGPLRTFAATGTQSGSFRLQIQYVDNAGNVLTSTATTISSSGTGTTGLALDFNNDLNSAFSGLFTSPANVTPFFLYPDFTVNEDPTLENAGSYRWVLRANDTRIRAITITNGTGVGFESTQYDDQRSTTLGFATGASVQNTVTAALPAPASGKLVRDVDFTLAVGGTNVQVKLFADDVNPVITALSGTAATTLQQLLKAEINAAVVRAGVTQTFDVTVASGKFTISKVTGSNVNLSVIVPTTLTSRASVTLAVDLADDSTAGGVAGRIAFKDLYSAGSGALGTLILPSARAEGHARLHIVADGGTLPGFTPQSVGIAGNLGGGVNGISLGLPGISFDFFVDATADFDYDSGSANSAFQYSDPHFHNVTLDPGSLLNSIIKPVAGTLNKVLGPVNTLIGTGSKLLSESVPVIDQVLGQNLSINGILGSVGLGKLTNYINSFVQIPTYITNLITGFNDAIANGRGINLGNWYYDGGFKPEAYGLIADSVKSITPAVLNTQLDIQVNSPGLVLDILNPGEALKLISGQTFNLVSFALGSANISGSVSTTPLNATIGVPDIASVDFSLTGGANINVTAEPVSIRYDSSGLQHLAAEIRSGSAVDFKHLYEGVYIDLSQGDEVTVSGSLSGTGIAYRDTDVFGVICDVRTGFNASLSGHVRLVDPTGSDKRISLNEIFALTNNFSTPQALISLFDAGVSFSGSFGIYNAYVLGLNFTELLDDIGIPTDFSVSADISFSDVFGTVIDNAFPSQPTLYSLDNKGVLTVNSGPKAALRLVGDTTGDNGENVTVSGNGTSLTLTVNNTTTTLTGVSRVVIAGGAGNDTIDASSLSIPVTIISGGGNDTLKGGTGADILDGSAGNNITIIGGGGADVITGGKGTGSISVSSTATTIYAGSGNNTITLSGFGHTVDAQDGSPTVTGGSGGTKAGNKYRLGTGRANVTVGAGNNTIFDGTGSHIINAAANTVALNFTTVGGNDDVTGTPLADTLRAGGTGNVIFHGGAGNDTLVGGLGDDLLDGGEGNDTLTGGGGIDTYNLGIGNNIVNIGTGTALFTDNNAVVNNNGGDGSDTIYGANARQGFSYNAVSGNDIVYGSAFADILSGGSGTDTLIGNRGANTLRGTFSDTLRGGATITGTAKDIALQGGNFADRFILDLADQTTVGITPGVVNPTGGTGTNNLSFRPGDTVEIDGTGSGAVIVTVDNVVGDIVLRTGNSVDSISVENVTGALTIDAGGGADIIGTGSTGSYPFQGITGPVSITGGSGGDSINVALITGPLAVNDSAGANDITATIITGLTSITGGSGKDTVTLTTVTASTIDTGDGTNSISVTNATGTTAVTGGTGTDTITVTNATGTISLIPAGGDDIVSLLKVSKASTIVLEDSDTISLDSVSTAVTLNPATGTTGNTTVNVNSLTAASTFKFQPNIDDFGTNTIKLTNLTADLTVNGGTGTTRRLLVTRAHEAVPRNYTLTATQVQTAGQGTLKLSNLTDLDVVAGTGGDTAAITGNSTSWTTNLAMGAGDDAVNAGPHFDSGTNAFAITGNSGVDTVTATITTTPVVSSAGSSAFNNFSFATVEQLIVDNSAYASQVKWTFTDRSLIAGAGTSTGKNPLIVTEGAANVRLLAGTNSDNTLSVTDSTANLQNITVGGSIVRIQENPNVLTPATASFVTAASKDTALGAYDGVSVASDGTVFGTGTRSGEVLGSFKTYNASNAPQDVLAIDLNNDSILDLVIPNNTLTDNRFARLLFGVGDGTFANPADLTVTSSNGDPFKVAAGDFNEDGKVDLVFTNRLAHNVSLLTGKGDGTFNTFTTLSVGSGSPSPSDIVVEDLDNDGNLDILVSLRTPDAFRILRGKGNGTFYSTLFNYGTGDDPARLAVGDFNNDGLPDIAVAGHNANTISFHINAGTYIGNDMVFNGGGNIGTNAFPYQISVADVNNDNNLDLVVGCQNVMNTFVGEGNGTFNAAINDTNAGIWSAAVADFDQDGKIDVVSGDPTNNLVLFNSGNGDGTLVNPVKYSNPYADYAHHSIGDFNGDNVPDIVYSNADADDVRVMLGRNIRALVTNPDSTAPAPALAGFGNTGSSVVSADGKFTYALRVRDNWLEVRNRSTQAIVQQINYGFKAGDQIQVSPENKFLYVLSQSDDTITYLSRNTVDGTVVSLLNVVMANPVDIALETATNAYVVNATGLLRRYSRQVSNGALFGAVDYTDGTAGITNLTGAKHVHVSSDGLHVYVATLNAGVSGIVVFDRNTNNGNLTFSEFVRNGNQGVTGLASIDGFVSKSISGKQFLFAISTADNTLVALRHEPSNGRLLPYQKLTHGVANVTGLQEPTGIALYGDQIFVSSNGAGTDGGIARFNLAAALAEPSSYDFSFAGSLNSLAVSTGAGDDTLVMNALTSAITATAISTGGGNDTVTINSTVAVSGKSTTIATGNGSDTVGIATIGANATFALDADGDADTILLNAVDANATVTLGGGSGADSFSINGATITSSITVYGNISGTADTDIDTLFFDAQSNTITPASPTTPDGNVRITGSTSKVTYTDIHTVTKIAGVVVNVTAPTVAEGKSATMTVSTTPAVSEATYDWDIDGDGGFGDATGKSITLTWAQLQSFGLGDNGTFPVQCRVTQSNAIQSYGSDILTVTDVLPTIAAPLTTATATDPYTLTLSATDPSATDPISKWEVTWGDGDTDIYYSASPTISHTYALRGAYAFTTTATDDDGNTKTFTGTQNVTHKTLAVSGDATADEGVPYTLSLDWEGLTIQNWYVTWNDGSSKETYTALQTTAAHTYLNNGNFTPTVQARYFDTGSSGNTTTVTVASPTITVSDVGPVASISGPSAVAEHAVYTLSLAATASPAGGTDIISKWVVTWGDGSTDTMTGNLTATTVSHTYADEGQYTITAVAYEANASTATNAVAVTVTDVAPVLVLTPDEATFNEGGLLSLAYTLTPSSTTPNDLVSAITFNWGDGTSTNYTNPTPNTTINLVNAKQYDLPGSYLVTVTTTTIAGIRDQSETILVTVLDTAPTISISGPTTVAEGTPYTLTLNHTAQPADPVLGWSVLWGDGVTEFFAADVDGSTTVTHIYADDGTAIISAALRTTVGTYLAGAGLPVTITAIAPTIAVTSNVATINEGGAFVLTVNTSNQGSGFIVSNVINWGDGTTETFTGGNNTFSHVYVNDSTTPFNVTVTSKDNSNQTGNIATTSVTVADVVPTVVFLTNPPVFEDTPYSMLIRISDPGVNDITTQVRINWGDASGIQNYPLTTVLNPVTGYYEGTFTHTFANPGTFTVSTRASSPVNGAFSTQTVTVLATPPAPSIAATGTVSGVETNEWNENTTVAYDLTLNYGSAAPTLSKWVINWGDGSALQTVTTAAGSITVPHMFVNLAFPGSNKGDYSIRATATDATGNYALGVLVHANDVPVLGGDTKHTITEDTPASFTAAVTDGDDDLHTYVLTTLPTKGVVTFDPVSKTFTYTPNLNATGADLFRYTANDGLATSNSRQVNITINAVNDPPVLPATQIIATNEGVAVIANTNVTDVDSTSFTFATDTAPANGIVTYNAGAKTFTYTPNAGFNGIDTFTFHANDTLLNSNISTVTVAVNNVAPATGGLDGPAQLIAGETGTYSITNIVDSPADLLTMKYSFALSAAGLAANYAAAQTTNSYDAMLPVGGTFNVFGRCYDIDGGISNITSLLVSVYSAPTVTGIVVNDGAVHHSRLSQIVISLASPMVVNSSTFSGLGAISLTRITGGPATVVQTGAIGASGRILVAPLTGLTSTLTLTFDNSDGSPVTAGVESGSLSDGRWQLAIPLLGYVSDFHDNNLRRLYGDVDGNGTVDGIDFVTFGNAFNSTPANLALDYDGNGMIDSIDLVQLGNRFGLTL